MAFGKRVAFIREREGMMQKELADKIGISARKLSDYEREKNDPKDEIKIEIARALNISMDYLFGLNDTIVSFDRKDVIFLPRGFPDKLKPELKEYATYLMNRKK